MTKHTHTQKVENKKGTFQDSQAFMGFFQIWYYSLLKSSHNLLLKRNIQVSNTLISRSQKLIEKITNERHAL